MGNEIEDELEEDLEELLKKKFPKLAKALDEEKVYLDWGEPEIYDEHTTRDSLTVKILEADSEKEIGKIDFDYKIHWSKDLGFGGWDELAIMPSTLEVEITDKRYEELAKKIN